MGLQSHDMSIDNWHHTRRTDRVSRLVQNGGESGAHLLNLDETEPRELESISVSPTYTPLVDVGYDVDRVDADGP